MILWGFSYEFHFLDCCGLLLRVSPHTNKGWALEVLVNELPGGKRQRTARKNSRKSQTIEKKKLKRNWSYRSNMQILTWRDEEEEQETGGVACQTSLCVFKKGKKKSGGTYFRWASNRTMEYEDKEQNRAGKWSLPLKRRL